MYDRNFLEFIAICDKIQIENNSNLTRAEKEFGKQFIDFVKNKAKQNY